MSEEHPHQPPAATPIARQHRRRRRHHSQPSGPPGSATRLWVIGTAMVPPVAALGLALIAAAWAVPGAFGVQSLRLLAYAVIGLLLLGLTFVLVGARPGARRLHRPMFWLSILLAVITIGAMLGTMRYVSAPAEEAPVSQPPAD